MSYYEIGILTFFEYLVFIILIYALNQRTDIRLNLRSTGIIIITIALDILLNISLNNRTYSTLISVVLYVIIFCALTKHRDKLDRIGNFFATSLIYFLLLATVSIGTSILAKDFSISFLYGMIVQIICVAIALILIGFPKIKKVTRHLYQNKLYFYILANIYLFFIVIFPLFPIIMQTKSFAIGIVFVNLIILVTNIVLIRQEIEKSKLVAQLNIHNTYIPIIEEIIDEIKRKQHDYHNHFTALSQYVETHAKDDKIKDYLLTLKSDPLWQKLVHIKSAIIIALLYSKIKEAQSQNIQVNLQADNHGFTTNLTDYQLVEVLGVLIDNAIDASIKQSDPQITIIMRQTDQGYYLRIANKYPFIDQTSMNKFFNKGYSTKTQSHGIGLPKIAEILKNSNNRINVYYDTELEMIVFEIYFCIN